MDENDENKLMCVRRTLTNFNEAIFIYSFRYFLLDLSKFTNFLILFLAQTNHN